MFIEKREIPERAPVDVVVAGGGVGGVAAALAAVRHGVQVLLLEKGAVLGGACHLRSRQLVRAAV